VRITDSALVAATTLSNRYITDRFLPDKAIDLMDEAAARLKMQVDSKPEELDSMDREIIRLKIEQEALKKESDAGSKSRLQTLEKELAELEKRSTDLTSRWSAEKNKLSNALKLKSELDALRIELANAQRRGANLPQMYGAAKRRRWRKRCRRKAPASPRSKILRKHKARMIAH
jgi:ATP-dependent Clp protease ATP-binding subunit ClpB